MNQKTNKQLRFKILVTLICTLSLYNFVTAQKRPPQNVRRVTVTCQYVFENGQKTEKYWPIYQEIYDSLGRLHTEIKYDFITHAPIGYIWHTFSGKQKRKTEVFGSLSLQTIEEFTYNADSSIAKKIIKKVNANDTSIFLSLEYSYKPKRKQIVIDAKKAAGKRAFVSKSTYNTSGDELTRTVRVKKTFSPQDSIIKLLTIPGYDSIGRKISEILTITKIDKSVIKKVQKFTYDKNSNLIQLVDYDETGKQVKREAREYTYSRNRLSTIKYYDRNDLLVKMIGLRYEIYRTNDRRFKVIDY